MNTLHLGMFLLATVAAAQDDDAKRILQKYRDTRPSGDDLNIYRLDWETNLASAKKRAAKERRPILLVLVRNDYGSLYTGAC